MTKILIELANNTDVIPSGSGKYLWQIIWVDPDGDLTMNYLQKFDTEDEKEVFEELKQKEIEKEMPDIDDEDEMEEFDEDWCSGLTINYIGKILSESE